MMARLLLAAACLLAPSLAWSQTTSAPVADMAAHADAVSAARDLLIAAGFEKQMEQSAFAVGNMAFNEVVRAEEQRGGEMPADLLGTVRAVLNEEISGMVKDLKATALDDAAEVYATYFTGDEIRRLAVLNQDPVMKKAQSIMPQMVAQLGQIGMKVATARRPAMTEKLKTAIDDWMKTREKKGEGHGRI